MTRTNAVTSTSKQGKAAIWVMALLSVAGAVVSPEPLPVLASALCFGIIIRLLWSDGEPPILLLPALFQWSEVAIWPLSTIWRQVPMVEFSEYGFDLDPAAYYGLAGVAMLAIGLRLGSGKSPHAPFAKRIGDEALLWSYRDVSAVAFSAIAFGYIAAFLFRLGGPTRELFNQLSNIKYVGLFVLTYWCLLRRSHPAVLIAVIACEVAIGMTGFFADFKNSILVFVVAAIAAKPKLRLSHVASVGASVALLLLVAIFWSAVKQDYRLFVNQGTGSQVVLVPLDQRLRYMADQASAMDGERFAVGFNRLINRHGYLEYLAATMRFVPSGRPYDNGQITLDVLKHISMPRLLFPNKAPLPSDTIITARYTGLPLGYSPDTSMSIGYLGELYADFGPLGGLLATAFIGFGAGYLYRVLRDQGHRPVLLVAGLCLMIALPFAYFGQPYSKTIGAAVFSAVVALVARSYWLPFVIKSRFRRPRRGPRLARPVPQHGMAR